MGNPIARLGHYIKNELFGPADPVDPVSRVINPDTFKSVVKAVLIGAGRVGPSITLIITRDPSEAELFVLMLNNRPDTYVYLPKHGPTSQHLPDDWNTLLEARRHIYVIGTVGPMLSGWAITIDQEIDVHMHSTMPLAEVQIKQYAGRVRVNGQQAPAVLNIPAKPGRRSE